MWLHKRSVNHPLEAAGTNVITYAGQDDGTGWKEMMDEEHEKG